ncbi:MAG: SDR family oxidoreductase [Anaerolinea sp.]|jgi:NAD(P)-dependent dehydrogenase (short-subunit alcohol dehydrogenase family)
MKTVLITGSTDGIGKQTALELARRGWRVFLHGRNLRRGEEARREILRQVPQADITCLNADFSSLEEVRQLARVVLSLTPRLDALVNNAGVFLHQRLLSRDGFEMNFAVNHLAHFLLTNLLLGLLQSSAPARVVTVSSVMHRNGRLNLEDLQMEQGYTGSRAYAASKLMNVLFAAELARRMEGKGVTSNSLHPGVVATKMLREAFPSLQGSSLEEGAATSVFLVTAPDLEGVTGKYFEHGQMASCHPLAEDREVCAQLWDISARLSGLI